MRKRNDIEIHSENTNNNRWRREEAGDDSHHFHHFIRPEIDITDIQVLDVHQYITILFRKIIRLHNMVVDIFEVFGIPFL